MAYNQSIVPDHSKRVSWPMLVLGVLVAILGIVCVAWPGLTIGTVSLMVGIGFLVSGVAGIMGFFLAGGFAMFSGWLLFDGIMNLILGIMFIGHPVLSGIALIWLIGTFVIIGGVALGVSAWRMRELLGGVWWLGLLVALLVVVFGIMMLTSPGLLSVLLGVLAIVEGVAMVVGSFATERFYLR